MNIKSNLASLEHLVSQRANKTLDSQAELIAEERALHNLKRMCSDKTTESETHQLKFPTTTSHVICYYLLNFSVFHLLSYKTPTL